MIIIEYSYYLRIAMRYHEGLTKSYACGCNPCRAGTGSQASLVSLACGMPHACLAAPLSSTSPDRFLAATRKLDPTNNTVVVASATRPHIVGFSSEIETEVKAGRGARGAESLRFIYWATNEKIPRDARRISA